MKQDKHDTPNTASARRRLLRGTFSAPVALTLFSGSVAARSVINCVTKRATGPELPGPTPDQGTTYIRVRLQTFTGMVGSTVLTNRVSRWIKGSDVVALMAAGRTTYLTGSQWQLYDRDTSGVTTSCSGANFNPASAYASTAVGTIIGTTPTEAGNVPCAATTQAVTSSGPVGSDWVALRVNSSGDIVGVVGINDTANTTAISQTCWTSFRIG